MEESELERLKAVDAVRSKHKETFLQRVQQLQRQMQELQDCRKIQASGENGNHKQPLTKKTTKPGNADLGVSTDKSTTTSIDKPAGSDNADSNSSTCGETDGATKESSGNQSKELAAALMAQQLPPLSKFNGSDFSSKEPFQDWIAQFAGVYKWSPQAKLIHLTTRLRGEAFTFYRSCSKQQKASYDLLVKELTRRFTPVRIQSVQTSLFHDRKQGDHESIDSNAQDLKSRFYKAYPQSQQGNEAAESMG